MTTITNPQAALNAVYRRDLLTFIQRGFYTVSPGDTFMPNWHLEAIAHALQEVYFGKTRRLLINIPPRYLKSISTSVGFVAWLLGQDPTLKIVCASYSQELASKHHRDTRAILQSPWYRQAFPGTRLSDEKNTESELMTTRRGERLATSVGGTLTGRGGDYLILDDVHKPDEVLSDTKRHSVIEWYRQTLLTRLNDKRTGRIIVIGQRLHEEDLAGVLLEEGGWTHLNLPAIADEPATIPVSPSRIITRAIGDVLHPKREPQKELDALANAMGEYAFSAQYQQQPVPLGGGIVKWDWFARYDTLPEPADHYRQIVQSWDTAVKAGEHNDYSVCTTWLYQDNLYYLLDVYRKKLEFPALQGEVTRLYEMHNADCVLIEDQGAGTALIQSLQKSSSLSVIGIKPEQDKATRLMAVSALIESQRVLLPHNAPWIAAFQSELVRFPKSKHDDQVDSFSQYLNWAREREPGTNSTGVFVIFSRVAYEMADREEQESINAMIAKGLGKLGDYPSAPWD